MTIAAAFPRKILVTGAVKPVFSVCVCLLRAGHVVTLLHPDEREAKSAIDLYGQLLREHTGEAIDLQYLGYATTLVPGRVYDMAIAITPENLEEKKRVIRQLEEVLPANTPILVNMESFRLSVLQGFAAKPAKLLGANWTEPAHLSRFLEVVTNDATDPQVAALVMETALGHWQKDPYLLRTDIPVRSRLLCALLREAFFLLENDYVSIEGIDRSLRNDGGYFLPFAGNFRYMDLMGTYMYGVVMKDLNPDLSTQSQIPAAYQGMLARRSAGMENNGGFYSYMPGEAAGWHEEFQRFSYQIARIIQQYPFNGAAKGASAKT